MKLPRSIKTISVVIALAITAMACITPTETPPLQTTPTAQPTAVSGPSTTPTSGLNSAQIHLLAKATVRISITQYQGGDLVTLGTGSGTILSPDGLILTNCHVAAPELMGEPEYTPDALVIEMVDREDLPPVPTYIAKVLAADPTLDLAVIKISSTLDGADVEAKSLNLPFVALGDSDQVQFGDPLYIFGFPGIGGETITYTGGNVSGFDAMEPIGNRAWIKTDATIAGGNSGGLATNNRGEIIGIPTRGGTSSASRITDCRQIADTNGDGYIDENDSCVPMGGFINAIRPINWALPLIAAAQNQTVYISPYGGTEITTTTAGSGTFTLNTWTSATDSDNCPVDRVTTYSSGTTEIIATFDFVNMETGVEWAYKWFYDDREVASGEEYWEGSSSGSCYSFSLVNGGEALPDGDYSLKIFTGSNLGISGSAKVSVGGIATSSDDAVTVSGSVTDANTGRGIADIYILVLKPGIDPDQWLQTGSDNDVISYAQSDSRGYFSFSETFERGVDYGVIAGNNETDYFNVTGYMNISPDDTNPYYLTIQMTK